MPSCLTFRPVAVAAVCFGCFSPSLVFAQSADDIAANIEGRAANEGRVGTMVFKMINAKGRERNRTALMLHAQQDHKDAIAIFFTAPARIEETAFLSYDHEGDVEDENWLYMPATQRVRRLPTSDRGDYFLGTDLTYGDIKDDFKFKAEDWAFSGGASDGEFLALQGKVKSAAIGKDMGYSAFSAKIDPASWFPVEVVYFDPEGEKLKTVRVPEVEKIGGAWTAMRFDVEQHQSGHKTQVHFEDMRYIPTLDPAVFDPEGLQDGVPEIGG